MGLFQTALLLQAAPGLSVTLCICAEGVFSAIEGHRFLATEGPLIAAKNPSAQVGRVTLSIGVWSRPALSVFTAAQHFPPLLLSCLLLHSGFHIGCLCVVCGYPCLALYKTHGVVTH